MSYTYNGETYNSYTAMYRAKHGDDGEDGGSSSGSSSSDGSGLVSEAAAGTIAAVVDDAGNATEYENDSAGGVGSSIDGVVGPGGVVEREDMTDAQTDQRQTVVVSDGDGDGGGLVYTQDDEVVGTGPGGDEVLEDQEDGVTYDGYTSLGGYANPGDPIVITFHAHRESGDPSNWDERTVEARVKVVDLSDQSTVWEDTYHAQVGTTSEKRRLGTIDGLPAGRYRSVLLLDGERADVSSTLNVGGGGPSYGGGGLANSTDQSDQSDQTDGSADSDSTTDSSDSAAARVVSLPTGGEGGAGAGVALAVLAVGAAYAATR